jgi:hypothetical protein
MRNCDYPAYFVLASFAEPNLPFNHPVALPCTTSTINCVDRMADFVKGLFGGQKPVQAPASGDDGMYTFYLQTMVRVEIVRLSGIALLCAHLVRREATS